MKRQFRNKNEEQDGVISQLENNGIFALS